MSVLFILFMRHSYINHVSSIHPKHCVQQLSVSKQADELITTVSLKLRKSSNMAM